MDKLRKVKYIQETMEHTVVDSYDGQAIYIASEIRYQLGNYLGGGIAGVVYEAFDRKESRQTAIKILNPIGYKLTPASTLKKCAVAIKGIPVSNLKTRFTLDHVWWLVHPTTRQCIAAYQDGTSGKLSELPLSKCVEIYGWNASNVKSSKEDDDPIFESSKIPTVPAKFVSFLKNRQSIYREIAHMQKLTRSHGHVNVLKLFNVLELTQTSKSTIFLVLELATGGELFDRIKPDFGVDESTAQVYFQQLVSGVMYCHQLGIVHRDLKPENLLLSDTDVLKIADFGLSAHFIATAAAGNGTEDIAFRRLKSIVGSPHYVAPEVLSSDRYGYDGRKADMWSLGVILYGMLVGKLPFGKELHYCARHGKFAEWVRSLPLDSFTGRLSQHHFLYQDTLNTTTGLRASCWSTSQQQRRPKLEFPSWFFPRSISIEARMLLSSLLHPDPAKRISCEEALKHPWVIMYN